MALPQTQLVTSLVTTYRNDMALQGFMVGASAPDWNIFDSVPTNQGFPYVVLNDITATAGTLLTMPYGKAHDILLQIDVFSRYQGFNEARAIASRIDDLTNEQSQAMTDFANPFTLIKNYVQKVEPDGITRRVMLEYLFMTQGG